MSYLIFKNYKFRTTYIITRTKLKEKFIIIIIKTNSSQSDPKSSSSSSLEDSSPSILNGSWYPCWSLHTEHLPLSLYFHDSTHEL